MNNEIDDRLQHCVTELPPGNWGLDDYREFSKQYFFHPYAIIEKTGKEIADCLPKARPDRSACRFCQSF